MATQYFFNQANEILLYALTSDTGADSWITWKVGLLSDHVAAYTFVATHDTWSDIGTAQLEAATNNTGYIDIGTGGGQGGSGWTLNLTRTGDTISAEWAVLPNWSSLDHDDTPANLTGMCLVAYCDLDGVTDNYLFSYHAPTSPLPVNGSDVDISFASSINWDLELPNA